MSKSLKNKAVKGVGWSFLDNIASHGVSFLVGIILARILSPSEFGLLGMITIFTAMSHSIVDSGFSSALIRKKDVQRIDYNTVFFFNIAVSILFYGLFYIASPAIALFFDEPQLIDISRVLGLVLILNGFGIIQRTILVKKIDFKTQTKVSIIASVGSGVIGIFMAIQGFGVWSLVCQLLSRQFLNTLFLWLFNSWRPIFEFSYQSFKELFSFGSKLLLSGIIDTTFRNAYYIIIGRFYTASQLGQYTRAEQFNMIFSSNLTSIIQRVSFPAFSAIQDDSARLKHGYKRLIKLTMLVTFACMLGLAAVAKPMILILIGDDWLPSVGYLQIICFSGMLFPLHAINLNMLQVKGRSDLILKLEILKKILSIFPVCLGIFMGIEYMLIGAVVNSFIAYILNSAFSASLIEYSTGKQIRDVFPTFLISLIVSFIMWSITLLQWNNIITIVTQCFIGTTLYIIIYEMLKLSEYIELKGVALSILHRK